MVTISGKQPKPRAATSIKKFGKHFGDCYRQTRRYCKTNKKKGESVAQCAQGICHWHLRFGSCAIGEVHKFGASARRNRATPGKAYLARLKKRQQQKNSRS